MHGKRPSRLRWIAAALLSAVLLIPAAVLACEACKDAVKDDPVGAALSATTLVLMAMPALLIGSIGGWVSYVYWRASRHAVAADGASASRPV